jgi:hypothetical protein
VFDFYASERHYTEHLLPVYFALPTLERGNFYAPASIFPLLASEGIHPLQASPPLDTRPIVVASAKDMKRCGTRPLALLEHGAGQTYQGIDSPSYPGGTERDRVKLFLCPSQRVVDLNRARYRASTAVVGCPKLDRWQRVAGEPMPPPRADTTIAFAFHWDCRVVPEARWAFPAFQEAIVRLAKSSPYRLVGHGHPRVLPWLAEFYRSHGIEVIEQLDDVLATADLYVCDNSSSMYEAAFAGLPVLALDAPWYRHDVEHGLRFWDCVPGLRSGHDENLEEAIELALLDPLPLRAQREAAARAVYEQPVSESGAEAASMALQVMLHDDDAHGRVRSTNPYGARTSPLAPILPERRFRRLGALPEALQATRLRWLDMTPTEQIAEQQRIADLTDVELAEALREMVGADA